MRGVLYHLLLNTLQKPPTQLSMPHGAPLTQVKEATAEAFAADRHRFAFVKAPIHMVQPCVCCCFGRHHRKT